MYFLSPEKVVQLFLLKEVKPSPDHKVILLLKFDNFFPSLRHFANTSSRITTAITFSRQKIDAGSRAPNN